jgi:lysophospholipase L1-like esterase
MKSLLALLMVLAHALAAAQPAPLQVPPLPEPADASLPSLFLIGDSTVRNGRDDGQGKGDEGQWGWGNPIAASFDTTRINVVNRAIGGFSSRTYITTGQLERTLAMVKKGDTVIMQFGHNDSSPVNDASRARGTLKGTGDETEEIDNLLTKQHEVVHTFGWYLRQAVIAIKARGATAIICSPIPRKQWDAAGRVRRSIDSHAGWAAQVAREQGVGFIDLNETVAQAYDALGKEAVLKLFPQSTPAETVHPNWAGSVLNARHVIDGLRTLNSPLVAYMLDQQKPTLFVVGDSTVRSNGQNGNYGWGEFLAPYFDSQKINIANHAIGGRSSRTFLTEGRWAKVLASLKKGDFVVIQFGHNDGGRIGDPAMKNRASGPGIGPEEVDDTRPDGTVDKVHTFGWYMAKYVAEARAKGATVIIASPVPHKDKWEGERDFANFAEWGQQVAGQGGAQFIDLTMRVTQGYRNIGAGKVAGFFADARTHTNKAGAEFNAARLVEGLRALKNNPLAPYLVEQTASWGKQGKLLYAERFGGPLSNWIVEYAKGPASLVAARKGKLDIDVAGGATVWFKHKLEGDFLISYKRTVLVASGRNDRLSDLNQFWMASDLAKATPFGRDGVFESYDTLQLYYAGIGGNTNTTTRLRKYEGNGERTMLADLDNPAYLLTANHEVLVQVAVYKGSTRVLVDGKPYFSFKDDQPLKAGYFGFRTTQSHQLIDDFTIHRLD